jgi:hypothetical protein
MNRHLIELLSALNGHDVKYLVVGGYAVSFHAQPRATKDIDILIEATPANAELVFAALAEFGAPLQGFSPSDFAAPGSFFRIGREPNAVDILCGIPGVDFAAAWPRRVEGRVEKDAGVTVPFIGREDLISAKLASGRPQDLADVAAIEKAAKAKRSAK